MRVLGLSFYRNPRGVENPCALSGLKRLTERLRRVTSRNGGVSLRERMRLLDEYTFGWLAIVPSLIGGVWRGLDQRLRRRLRACVWVQWKRAALDIADCATWESQNGVYPGGRRGSP